METEKQSGIPKGTKFTKEHTGKIQITKHRILNATLAKAYGMDIPGDLLYKIIIDRKINPKAFAKKIGLTSKQIEYIISGRIEINADIAKKLEKGTGITAASWLREEMDYWETIEKLAKGEIILPKKEISLMEPALTEEDEQKVIILEDAIEKGPNFPKGRSWKIPIPQDWNNLSAGKYPNNEPVPILSELEAKITKRIKKSFKKKLLNKLLDRFIDKSFGNLFD